MTRAPSILAQLRSGRRCSSEGYAFSIRGKNYVISPPGVGGHVSVESLPALRLAALRRGSRHWDGAERTKLDLKLRPLGYSDAYDRERPPDVIEIQNITVHPSQRRQGLATALLRRVASLYPEALIQGSGIDVRIRLCPQLGFTELLD